MKTVALANKTEIRVYPFITPDDDVSPNYEYIAVEWLIAEQEARVTDTTDKNGLTAHGAEMIAAAYAHIAKIMRQLESKVGLENLVDAVG